MLKFETDHYIILRAIILDVSLEKDKNWTFLHERSSKFRANGIINMFPQIETFVSRFPLPIRETGAGELELIIRMSRELPFRDIILAAPFCNIRFSSPAINSKKRWEASKAFKDLWCSIGCWAWMLLGENHPSSSVRISSIRARLIANWRLLHSIGQVVSTIRVEIVVTFQSCFYASWFWICNDKNLNFAASFIIRRIVLNKNSCWRIEIMQFVKFIRNIAR